MKSVPQLIRAGLWPWTKGPGLERFELLRAADEWILQGTIIALAEHMATEARYEIVCDESWHTRRADISLRDGSGERVLAIAVENGQWYENGRANKTVAGCMDIDLEWSPSTNTIPIRRLRLAVGQKSGPVVAAWVRFPDLRLQPLLQEYERTSNQCYRYSSGGGAFVAEITVDEESLALSYEGFWQRAVI
jgi:uncharacterized protein